MTRLALAAAILGGISATSAGQVMAPRPPVIDMHVHSTSGSPQEQLARMNELNIRYVWLTGLAPDFPTWAKALPEGQFLQALILPCITGRSPFVPRPCWEGTADFPDTAWLREELRTGRIKALGEMAPQLFGIIPGLVASGIDAIRTADFLSEGQKADILCLNATRFLRIATAICAP
jgi:hypothetical protein